MLSCTRRGILECASRLSLAFPSVLRSLGSACLSLKQRVVRIPGKNRNGTPSHPCALLLTKLRLGLGSWVWDRARRRRNSWSFQRLEAVLPSLLSVQSSPAPWVCVLLNAKDQSPFNVKKKRRPCSQPPRRGSAESNSITCTFPSCSFSCLSSKSWLKKGSWQKRKKKKPRSISNWFLKPSEEHKTYRHVSFSFF